MQVENFDISLQMSTEEEEVRLRQITDYLLTFFSVSHTFILLFSLLQIISNSDRDQ